jgi:phage tail-like protein
MALSKEDIKMAYPLPVYNYRVEIGGQSIGFSEVSGLSIAYETFVYKESPTEASAPGPRVMRMPAQGTDTKITLKKGLVRGTSIAVLFKWINAIQINLIEKKDVFVRLCDESGNPVISWKIINAFPIKLDAPTFDAKSNDAAIETMELMADGVTIEET